MKRTIDEHAARFDERAANYDDTDRPVYEECAERVIEAAAADSGDVILDLGTGTGAIALGLAPRVERVIARDISPEMMGRAREKAATGGIDNVSFEEGRFRQPNYEGPVDVVVSNYAMHHLDDPGKREAIAVVAGYRPRRFVLGDIMIFGDPDPDDPGYDPDVDDPASVGHLVDAMTSVGFDITDVTRVTDEAGVIVAEEPRDGWET